MTIGGGERLLCGIAVSVVVGLGGCKKGPTPGGVHLKEVSDALAAAGYKTDGFQQTDPLRFSAKSCAEGALAGVATLVCEFGSPEAVALGKKAGESWVAQATTGAVLTNGLTLLALADRARADHHGQTIHKVTKVYSAVK
jgi:hypothetical protein